MTTTASSTAPKSIPQPPKSTARACNGNADLSSSPGSIRSSKSSKLGHTPPYWNRRNRSVSNVSYISINAPTRRPPILLEDHTEAHHESNNGLWARGVKINDYHVVSGSAIGAGSYVVWHCLVETLEVCYILIAFISIYTLNRLFNAHRCALTIPILTRFVEFEADILMR